MFRKIITEKNFTDREKETADLLQSFTSLIICYLKGQKNVIRKKWLS